MNRPGDAQYLALQNAGIKVHADLPTDKTIYQTCILVWGKFRQLNEAMVNRARAVVSQGGLIIITGAKNRWHCQCAKTLCERI